MKYYLRPTEVEAFQWCMNPEPEWFAEAIKKGKLFIVRGNVMLYSLKGTMLATPGWWIVKHSEDHFDFVSNYAFSKFFTAEKLDDTSNF